MDHPAEPCVFCRIVRQPDHVDHEVIYDDREHIAFLGKKPNTVGGTVLITKGPYGSDLLTLPIPVLSGLMAAAVEVNKLLTRAFRDVDRVAVAGEGYGVAHAHFRLFPLHGTRDADTGQRIVIRSQCTDFYPAYEGFLRTNDAGPADRAELRAVAGIIRAA
jgi:histidine triad (HIT) family protein